MDSLLYWIVTRHPIIKVLGLVICVLPCCCCALFVVSLSEMSHQAALQATQTVEAGPVVTARVMAEATGTALAIATQKDQANVNAAQTAERVQALTTEAATRTMSAADVASPTPQPTSTSTASERSQATEDILEPESEREATDKCTSNMVFVKDVSIPDDTVLKPGEAFEKVWMIRNSGNCPWDGSYRLAHVDGHRLGASESVELGQTVDPGDMVDLGVKMQAPENDGRYLSWWQMRDASGSHFGEKVFVEVEVKSLISPDTVSATNTASPVPKPTTGSGRNVILRPGQFSERYGYAPFDYPMGGGILIAKKDGTVDERRNDLEELCKDWYYYRSKILEHASKGNLDKAEDARKWFRAINAWLEEYDYLDVAAMNGILEETGYEWAK